MTRLIPILSAWLLIPDPSDDQQPKPKQGWPAKADPFADIRDHHESSSPIAGAARPIYFCRPDGSQRVITAQPNSDYGGSSHDRRHLQSCSTTSINHDSRDLRLRVINADGNPEYRARRISLSQLDSDDRRRLPLQGGRHLDLANGS